MRLESEFGLTARASGFLFNKHGIPAYLGTNQELYVAEKTDCKIDLETIKDEVFLKPEYVFTELLERTKEE